MEKKILTGQDVANIMLRYIDEIEKDPSFELYVSLTPAIHSGTEDVFDDIFGTEAGKSAYGSFMSDLDNQKDYGGELKKEIDDVRKGLNILSDIHTKGMDIAHIKYSTRYLDTYIMFYKDGAQIECGTSLANHMEVNEIDIRPKSSEISISDKDEKPVINHLYERFDSTGLTIITDPILEAIKREYPETYIAF
ncbi:hypothetical protein GQ472_03335 [archaeon]|nr:hypothetical protein [archaeon]